jgi:putative hydrolase of the HAD superfamily
MNKADRIDTLFLDVGGVLLTNGWDRKARSRAAREFGLDNEEFQERHHMVFDSYEKAKFSLDDYLSLVVFHRDRPFTKEDFTEFMLERSRALPGMINLVRSLKAQYGLKTVVVSNEGRELADYRIKKFKLTEFIDSFIFSCFVQFRKPETAIFRIALDVSQADPRHVVYLDDREMFVEVAQDLGIAGIHHLGYQSTRAALAKIGLQLPE